MAVRYQFSAIVWQHAAPGGWYFVSLPPEISKEIRLLFQSEEEGWGRLKAVAKIDALEWKTAIWFDTKRNTYLLPLKSDIRKKALIAVDTMVEVVISI